MVHDLLIGGVFKGCKKPISLGEIFHFEIQNICSERTNSERMFKNYFVKFFSRN